MGGGGVKRLGGLAFVAALHLAALAMVLTGSGPRPPVAPPRLVMAQILPEDRPAPPVPPPPAPPTPPVVKPVPPPPPPPPPPRPVRVSKPPPPAPNVIAAPAPPPPQPEAAPPAAAVAAVPPSLPPPEPVRLPARVATGHSCTPPEYPAMSRRLGESGAVVIKFLVDENGTVLDSVVESSSGHSRLDEAARDALSLCRFTPGSVDGRPERAWARLRYVWKLE